MDTTFLSYVLAFCLIIILIVYLHQITDGNKANKEAARKIKQKFGTLRFYYEGGNEHIRTIVDYTEFISGYICEQTGSMNDVGYNNKGFIQVLHKDLAKNKNDFNFVDDEELRTILKTYDQKINAQQ